jgi:hypothetical protein
MGISWIHFLLLGASDKVILPLHSCSFFVTNGLSTLLQDAVDNHTIEPLKVCRTAPGVSHLLFADDSLLFFKAQELQAQRVKDILDTYASRTG